MGGNDLEMSKLKRLKLKKKLTIILGATHLFEEPGKLEQVNLLSAVLVCKLSTSLAASLTPVHKSLKMLGDKSGKYKTIIKVSAPGYDNNTASNMTQY